MKRIGGGNRHYDSGALFSRVYDYFLIFGTANLKVGLHAMTRCGFRREDAARGKPEIRPAPARELFSINEFCGRPLNCYAVDE